MEIKSFGLDTTPIVRTSATVRIAASPSPERNQNVPFGHTKNRTRQWRIVNITWRSMPHGSMQLKGCRERTAQASAHQEKENR